MKKIFAFLVLLCLLQPAFAQRKYDKTPDPLKMDMVLVKGGKFAMGDDSESVDRKPAHNVILKDFSICRFEVTERQWKAVMGANPSSYTYCSDCPVTNVSWDDAQAFIKKLNELTGRHYRLPTEAEWEYAARGGKQERLLQFSGKRGPQPIAWYNDNSKDHVHPVGRKVANELGIYDMSGNVEEWCNDWYSKDYYTKKNVTDPQGPDGGFSKVVRGGSWASNAHEIVVTRRAAYLPNTKSISLGFRLVE